MHTRRSFFESVLGLFSASRLPLNASARPPRRLERIGLQLYTVRNELRQDFDGTLARAAAIGYKEVEFAGYLEHSPVEIKAALTRHGLSGIAAHVPLHDLSQNLEQVLHSATTIGHQYVLCASLSPEQRSTLESYKRIAAEFNRIGELAQKAGIQFAYHNHDFEFARIDGQLPYDVLLAETQSDLVKMEMDLYWISKGNQDPVACFARYPGRYVLVHVKDMDHTAERGMTEVGRGRIDFKRILAQAAQAGTKHFFVEHDRPASAFDSIETSYAYLKQLEF